MFTKVINDRLLTNSDLENEVITPDRIETIITRETVQHDLLRVKWWLVH